MTVLTSTAFAKQEGKGSNIPRQMDVLFKYHIEYEKISPILVERSFKILIESADPEKTIFLQHEIEPYFKLSPMQTDKVIREYANNDFFEYSHLGQLIQNGYHRARKLREEVARELTVSARSPEGFFGESHLSFAKDEDELKGRIRRRYQALLSHEKVHVPEAKWTPEYRKKLMHLWEKRLQRFETPFYKASLNKPVHGGALTEELNLQVIKALAKSLDAHTMYYSPQEARDLRARLEKEFEGVGVVLRESVDGLEVAKILEGSPAARSKKLKEGDRLLEVNRRNVRDLSYEEVMEEMKGPGGKGAIELQIEHQGGEVEKVKLLKEKIILTDGRVKYQAIPCEGGVIGQIILPSFYESHGGSCEKDVREALETLKKEGPLLGVVLDLRENAGGFLKQAVKVANLFISRGVIVMSKYSGGQVKYLKGSESRMAYNGPLIVLTSKGSASAAEIVAGALQDYGAALVVGDLTTYGKGSIQFQTLTAPGADMFFKVTVGRYYTASGRSTQIKGVPVDIHVPTQYAAYDIGEKYLEYPLSSDQIPSAFDQFESSYVGQTDCWLAKKYGYRHGVRCEKVDELIAMLNVNSLDRQQNDPVYREFLEELKLAQQVQKKSGIRRMRLDGNARVSEFLLAEGAAILKDIIAIENQH